ncbi:MAG: peptidoglycan-associated lipoprotein [Deltaproteobacteria bacterium CG2_30_66_27]|nr:MAG: peptidoglycan-associated lipoprotein [Deltaproteobacteria bacterium CG2_30_66_27]PJB32500.1 MAG: peptidoglycan-associated lipoprotein [Deltaproteobacteria bacterium CG_4_9_14_3_um_filter_65_9]
MKGTCSWKWAVLALSVAALVAVGCAKKQTVKSEGTTGAPGAASAPGAVTEAPVKEAPVAVAPATPPAAAPGVAVTEEKLSRFDDVLFDFDQSVLREDGRKTSQVVADYLMRHSGAKLLIEGHCDERGTAEYNLALGERRATAVMTYLVSLGVPTADLSTVSFGEEKPLDSGHDEGAWAKNRRAHFVLK